MKTTQGLVIGKSGAGIEFRKRLGPGQLLNNTRPWVSLLPLFFYYQFLDDFGVGKFRMRNYVLHRGIAQGDFGLG